MIERLHIQNLRTIENRSWQMSKGVCELPMGPVSGKTTSIDAWAALFLEKHDFLPSAQGNSVIRAVLQLPEGNVEITRSWLNGHPSEWRVTGDGGQWNLLDGNSYKSWQQYYCKLFVDTPAEASQSEVYHAIVAAPVLKGLSDVMALGQVFKRQLVPAEWSSTADRLEEIYWRAYDRALKGRQHNASKIDETDRMQRIQKKIVTIDRELTESVEARQKLEKRCEDVEQNFRQLHRMYEFVVQARTDVDRLEYEESRYREALHSDSSLEGENGSRDAFERFQSIEREIHTLEARQIENRHYEKNLRGLQDEITRLDAEASAERAAIYREEMDRLQTAIVRNSTDDTVLEKLYEERERYRTEAQKHDFFERQRKADLSWNRETLEQHLMTTRRKLETARAELAGLDADAVVSRYEDERRMLRQWRQQIAELTSRINSIVDRRLRLLERRTDESTGGWSPVASIDTKKFLDLSRKGLSILCERQRQDRIGELTAMSEHFPDNWSTIGKIFGEILSDLDFRILTKVSHTERLLLSILLQASAARRLYHMPFCILPEHTAWLLPRNVVSELHRWLEAIGFRQVIMFVPPDREAS